MEGAGREGQRPVGADMMRLTEDQRRAVQSWQRGDICVIAGPGSGKTRVLVERLRWLVLERGAEPERILAITFTEKAALEMRARLVGEASLAGEPTDRLEAVQVSTIDAFCNRLLREHAALAGIDPGFEILDEQEARQMLNAAVAEALDWEFRKRNRALAQFLQCYSGGSSSAPGAVLEGLSSLATQVLSHGRDPFLARRKGPWHALSRALEELAEAKRAPKLAATAASIRKARVRNRGRLGGLGRRAASDVRPFVRRGKHKDLVSRVKYELLPACETAAAGESNRTARACLLRILRRALRRFKAAKQSQSRMDFDDTLAQAAKLLGSSKPPSLGYEHILIDEFQDTNPLQIRLVRRLLKAHGPLRPVRFVAGDVNQSIYGFRHAVREVFQDYRAGVEENGGQVVQLLDNFRSRPEILAAVHRILPGGGDSGVEKHRLRAAGQFPPKRVPCVELLIAAETGPERLRAEGGALAARLRSLHGSLQVADQSVPGGARALRWGDVAVLARTHAVASAVAAQFRREGVPCVTATTRGLFDAPVTAEVAAFLRALRNPRDEISLTAVLKSPLCGISDSAILQLRLHSNNLADSLDAEAENTGLDSGEALRFERFRLEFTRCREDRATVPAGPLLARALAAFGYRAALNAGDDEDQAADRLDQLLDWIGRQHMHGLHSVSEVSAALDTALKEKPPAEAAPTHGTADAVQVLTMHAAKGLEFPMVALVSLNTPVRRRRPGMLFSNRHGIGAYWTTPGGGRQPDAAYARTVADLARREAQEEERLLYVAMTRAEEHLILSASFTGKPMLSGWLKLVCPGLGVTRKSLLAAGSGETTVPAGNELRFLFRKTSGPPSQPAPAASPLALTPSQVLLPREAEAQADYAASVTSVALYAECPRKYFLSRYLGLGSEEWRGSEAREAEEPQRHRRRQDPDPSEFGRLVHAYLAGDRDGAKPSVRALARKFERHELGKRASAAWSVERETEYVFTVGGHVLRGIIDLLFEDGEGRVLVDYKTDRRSRSRLRESALKHAEQLQLYSAGLRSGGRPVDRAVVFYLRHGVAVDIDIGDAALAGAREQVTSLFRAQATQSFPLREGAHCRHCPHFRKGCPATGPEAVSG